MLPILCLCIFAICLLSVAISRLTSKSLVNGLNAAFYAPINSMYLLIVVSILASEVIAADYTQGLMRNLLISDKKRSGIFIGKLLLLYWETLLFILFCIVTYTVMYAVAFGWGAAFEWGQLIPMIRLFVLQALFVSFIVAVVTTVSIMLRNAVATIGICAGLAIVEIIIAKMLEGIPGFSAFASILPASLSSSLITPAPTLTDSFRALLFSFVFFIIASILGCLIFERQEIK